MLRLIGRFALILVVLSVTAGCKIDGATDSGFAFWFRNDSSSDVIVQFIDHGYGVGYAVAGGRTGGSLFGVSTYSGHIRVVTSDCRLLWEETVAQSRGGAVAVAPDLSVRLVEHAPDGVGRPLGISGDAVPETGACLPEGTEYAPDDPYASPS